MSRVIGLCIACGIMLPAQDLITVAKKIKVTGPENPFYADEIEIYERSKVVGGGYGIKGRIVNIGVGDLFDVGVIVTIKQIARPALRFEIAVDHMKGKDFQFFVEELPGLQHPTHVDTVSFSLKSAFTKIELDERERKREAEQKQRDAAEENKRRANERKWAAERAREQAARAAALAKAKAACQAMRAQIAKVPVSSLTVEQADARDACRAAGLW